VLASICADGTTLPPGIMYDGKNENIRDTWVDEISEEKHQVFITSSDSGWTNDDLGLAWLRNVFDRSTKEKCRRSWRLLILNGHGSHVTIEFINYCDENRILLAIFPPHSTHSLQLLDVVMFSPLQRTYQKKQGEWQQKTEVLRPPESYKERFLSVVLVSLYLFLHQSQHIVCLSSHWHLVSRHSRGTETLPEEYSLPRPRPSDLSLPHWNRVKSLVRAAVANHNKKLIQEVESLIHCASTHTKLLEYQNQGLEASLTIKKKRKKSSKALLLQETCGKSGGGYFFLPSSLKSAQALQAEYQHQEDLAAAQKADKM
jgi:hypothetical protein